MKHNKLRSRGNALLFLFLLYHEYIVYDIVVLTLDLGRPGTESITETGVTCAFSYSLLKAAQDNSGGSVMDCRMFFSQKPDLSL